METARMLARLTYFGIDSSGERVESGQDPIDPDRAHGTPSVVTMDR